MQRSPEAILLSSFTTGEARTASFEISLFTTRTSELIDITDHVHALVTGSDVESGIALISSPHTTCAVIVNEAEEGFTRDLERALEALAPSDAHYEHNLAPHAEEFEAPNGYAHVRAAFLSSSSVMLPIRDRGLGLGRWQRIFFIELDRARPRTCQITLVGRSA